MNARHAASEFDLPFLIRIDARPVGARKPAEKRKNRLKAEG
jgi:hypothetical protein